MIITGGDDGCIRLYGNELSLESSISAHDDIISTFSLNETNQQLISGSWDGTCSLWNFGEGNFTHVSSFLAHSGPVHDFTSQEQSPNICCSIGQDGFIRIWDFRQSGMNNSQSNCISLASLNQIGSSCSWSSSNPNHIICGLEDGNILSFDIRFSSSHDAAPTINYSSNLPIHTSRIERILTSSSLPVDGYISASSDGCIAFVSMSDNSSPKYSKW